MSRSSNDKLNVVSLPSTMDIKSYDEESYSDMNIQKIEKKEAIKVDISGNTIGTLIKENVKTENAQFNSNSTHIS